MLLSLGIFFLSERLILVSDWAIGQETEDQTLWNAAKLHEDTPHPCTFKPRGFPQETHDATFVPCT